MRTRNDKEMTCMEAVEQYKIPDFIIEEVFSKYEDEEYEWPDNTHDDMED